MRNLLLIVAAASLLLIVSCQQETGRQTSPGGYKYIVYTDSDGEQPQPGDYAYFHAQIRKGDSVVYRTRQQSPEPPFFQVPQEGAEARQPSPYEDVLRTMRMGDSATIFVPLDSLPQVPQGFEGVDEIAYDVVMVDIKSNEEFQSLQQQLREEAQARAADVKGKVDQIVAQYAAGELDDQITTTDSGLKYIILEQGSGPAAEPGKLVSVNYYGVLTDGQRFDDSYSRGQAFPFPLGQGRVIPGWDEGIDLLNAGAEAALFIPAELGYGQAGSPPAIPPNSELIFYVELEDVQDLQ